MGKCGKDAAVGEHFEDELGRNSPVSSLFNISGHLTDDLHLAFRSAARSGRVPVVSIGGITASNAGDTVSQLHPSDTNKVLVPSLGV